MSTNYEKYFKTFKKLRIVPQENNSKYFELDKWKFGEPTPTTEETTEVDE